MHDVKTRPVAAHRQRGAAALVVALTLLFAMALVVAFANRNLVFEQRSSANQYRSTQAFEAAEAGAEWALAQLNTNQRIGPDCRPSADPAATSFRSRYLDMARPSGTLTPRTWDDGGAAVALQASCVRVNEGWACSCPSNGLPSLPTPAGAAPAPAFSVRLTPTSKPGVVHVVANGCTSLAGACLAGSTGRPDASATIELTLALLPGLRTAPVASVTARGGFEVGSAAIRLHNSDPATGIAVDAGGAINAPLARLTPPAGAPKTGLLVGDDAALAALAPDRFFASYFGIDKAAWQRQPAATRVRCTTDCAAVIGAAIADAADGALIHVDGDLALAGPLALGSAQRPVAIVVSGAARLDGAITLTGALYAAALVWDHADSAGMLRGALVSEAGYQGNGAPELVYDRAVLEALQTTTGSFARVNGSWRDF